MTLSWDEAKALVVAIQARGGRVVFTNGAFDLLHPGHVRYLKDARALGDALIVAINSDRSVRAYKGPDRPLNPDLERAEVLQALGCVDAVVVFDDETPHQIISHLQPDVLVKGADWGQNEIVGRDVIESRGGVVVRMPLADGYSTTELIRRAQRRSTEIMQPGPVE